MKNETNNRIETIILGGGCFWCLEPIFNQTKGVISAVVGYAGGHTENPNYEEVYSGKTGHAEVIKVNFNPQEISLEKLLEIFFSLHDPTSINRQGNDIGPQYRSMILTTRTEQIIIINESIARVKKYYEKPIITEIKSLEIFYPAEDSHQNYFRINPNAPYCQLVISPKLSKFKKNFSQFLK